MEVASEEAPKQDYSVWAFPPEEVTGRLNKLIDGLRSEFGGPSFHPHITVVGATSLTADDALTKFHSVCEGLKAYQATIDRVDSHHQCVYLLIQSTPEVMEASAHCTSHFGYRSTRAYMPHISILYGDLTEEEKKKAEETANILDVGIIGLSFPVSRLALYITDTNDKTLTSWEKVAEYSLNSS